ncbi:MAG: hypothetical protein H6659_04815 [Ardenticatenaceae bacterium]|nr:hypothetical protein [Anaerolineales bacterium]MCB8983122.1 hypothetical protein [Ardenticatenaceae bacterium]
MGVATIRIQLDNKTARAYESSSQEQRERLQQLIGFMLQEFAESTPQSLLSLMDDMSQEAAAHGLTPEILDSLLQDE